MKIMNFFSIVAVSLMAFANTNHAACPTEQDVKDLRIKLADTEWKESVIGTKNCDPRDLEKAPDLQASSPNVGVKAFVCGVELRFAGSDSKNRFFTQFPEYLKQVKGNSQNQELVICPSVTPQSTPPNKNLPETKGIMR